ncbi:transforming growth factor beta activator LRRC32 [Aplochiton taeniatus]
MAGVLWVLLAFVAPFAPSVRSQRQLSPCQVVHRNVFCNDRNLRVVPAGLPRSVQNLDMSQNRLQNLTWDVLGFHNALRHLNLHSNKIQFIQPGLFENVTNLKVLNLSRNYLDVFALSKTSIGPLTTVESLDLSGNRLFTGMSDYFLSKSPALVNLSLNGNSITKVMKTTFGGSLSLRNIDLHNNVILEIEDGAFESLAHLSELDLSLNSITCITDFNLSHLKVLNLSRNSMENFQTTDSDEEYELLHLDLRENKIPYFPLLPRRNKLMYLDLSRNQLMSVNTTGTADDLEHFRDSVVALTQPAASARHQDFSRLVYLDVSYNQLKGLPQSFFCTMVSLEVLNVSNNCLESFSVNQESPLSSLKVLDLSYNALQNLSFGSNTLRSLAQLFLQGNNLNTIGAGTFQRLPSIRDLHLQRNYFRVCVSQSEPNKPHHTDHNDLDPAGCVQFNSIPTLHFLYLTENSLERLPAYAFVDTPLKLLDLSLNAGLEMDRDGLAGLEDSLVHLSLKENQIARLNTDLSALSSLKFVDLSSNKLSALPPWNRETSIESLNLQNNNLVTLEYSAIQVLERSLKTLYVGSNPLSCCGNQPLLSMVQHSAVVVPDIKVVTCEHMQGSELVEVNIESVTQEQCQTLDSSSVSIFVIVIVIVMALGLMGVLALLSKVCNTRRKRFSSSFRA